VELNLAVADIASKKSSLLDVARSVRQGNFAESEGSRNDIREFSAFSEARDPRRI
jgi:hypothetical protein